MAGADLGNTANLNVAVILSRVLHRELEVDEAIGRLSPFVDIELDANPSYASWKQPIGVEVRITSAEVRGVLLEYLSGTWDEHRLRRWAAFITHTAHYSAPEPPADDEDFNDDLWDTLHELSSPELFGDITPDRVREMLGGLNKYEGTES